MQRKGKFPIMKRILPFFAVLLSMLLCAGCGEEIPETSPVPPPTKKAISSPQKPVENSVPSEKISEPAPPKYRYDPMGRDPFESLLDVKQPILPERALTPLQKFDIGQLRLIGVIIGKGEPKAMIVAPDGKSYILKKGIKIGKNDGTVIGVTRDAVVVQERYIDFSGEVRTVVQEIMLPQREGVE
jgi:type IV pilus assembly protein PilP